MRPHTYESSNVFEARIDTNTMLKGNEFHGN